MKDIDYTLIPEHCQQSMRDYIERGILPGNFLGAIICNDFVTAAGQADDINRWCLFGYAQFLYTQAPSSSWGSPENLRSWHESGGLQGVAK